MESERDKFAFEQGPIRPPSEAYSLLIRATRNCTWNKCAFCHTYKGKRFEKRSVQEVKADIQAAKDIADEIKALSWRSGYGGEITREVVEATFSLYDEHFRSIALWLYFGGKHVFLQDANSIVLKTSELIEILKFLKDKFPHVERVTSYGRSSTIAKRKSVEELKELKEAGLTRLHVGLESGWDFLLEYMNKGVTAAEHIKAGKKVMESSIELSEYVILGLGGRRWWREHALETAKVLNQVSPHFIRLRTLKVLPQMPLQKKIDEGDFVLQTEEEMIVEERLLIESLNGINSTFLSDHILNLLMEVEGKLPKEKEKMLKIIDAFLALPPEEKLNFRLGKRAGIYNTMEDMSDTLLHRKVEELVERLKVEAPGGVEEAISKIKETFL
ncbi:MAG: radical SAM protein [Deltaproteobacteria bacterium]|nr:radical SAM protein [Deltaproteobacteria bacterium]